MTKLLRSLIDAENLRRGKTYPEIGSITSYTLGFGQKDDVRIGKIINEHGGVMFISLANARSFRKYLALMNVG